MDTRIELADDETTAERVEPQHGGLGVSLGSMFASISYSTRKAGSDDLHPIVPDCLPISPSILLPRLSSEPLRLDVQTPVHPRGVGKSWPPESALQSGEQGGRFPIAYALQELVQAKGIPWTWNTPEGEQRRLSAAEAIAGAFAATTAKLASSRGPSVLVIPNHLSMDRQQELIDACWSLGCQAKLLWRPVAAALAWCHRHGCNVLQNMKRTDELVGTLLCLHLGIDEFEIALLDVVRRTVDGKQWRPARRRTNAVLRPLPSFGMELLHRLAVNDLNPPCEHQLKVKTWGAIWASQWPFQVLETLRHGSSVAEDDLQIRRRYSDILSSIGSKDFRNSAWAGELLQQSPTLAMFNEWSQTSLKEVSKHRLVGAVVSGELASLTVADDRSLGQKYVAELAKSVPAEAVEIDDEIFSRHSILANGAALYSARIADGCPTYLDTLPRIQLGTYVTGKPGWLSLLTESDTYVDGGKVWQRPEPVQGLRALAGNDKLEVTLWHDEYDTARRVKTDYPTKLPRDVSILLDVSVEPAQGNARVEVVPDDPSLFGSRKVFMEWGKMEVLPETPQDWLSSHLPTLFPDLLKRAASSLQWSCAKREMERYIKRPNYEQLKNVIGKLSSRDSNVHVGPNEEASQTAVSSDGQPGSERTEVFDEFVNVLVRRVVEARRTPNPDLVRALAYTSTSDPQFQEFLAQRVKDIDNLPGETLSAVLPALGRCLRDPTHIAGYSEMLLRRLQNRVDGSNLWLKAFGEMLRYREDATRDIPSGRCEFLTRYFLKVLENELQARNAKFLFRNSCLCIVFLLRRRAFDDDYLRPGSHAYEEVRRVFESAISGFGELQAIGGAIDPRKILAIMIEYLDRKGPPILVGGIELRGLAE